MSGNYHRVKGQVTVSTPEGHRVGEAIFPLHFLFALVLPDTMTLLSETTAKGTGLAESAGKEDPVELDSSLTL
ncbi:hypothetical protein QVD99_002049 [Batrachochytrium dendrobatidis]|nr:hypothetical protein QVD99_002049 [Batrachochytrium dendrobatidis]